MEKEKRNKHYYVNNNIIFYMLSLVAGIFITLLLYNFIGTSESNRILSRDMLIAIKKYNVDIELYTKERIFIRGLELLVLVIMYKTKYRYFLNKCIMGYIGFKSGFILTIFILEMQFIGIVNFILVTFPQEFLYTYAIIRLFEVFEEYKNTDNYKGRIRRIALMVCNYSYITFLWGIALLSEIMLKNIFIKKLFITKC